MVTTSRLPHGLTQIYYTVTLATLLIHPRICNIFPEPTGSALPRGTYIAKDKFRALRRSSADFAAWGNINLMNIHNSYHHGMFVP